MPDRSQILSLPYIQPSQAQKHVTHNEALRQLDAIVQLAVADATLAAPPSSPAAGDRYIVASAASGAWAGQENAVAIFSEGAWVFYAPVAGWHADVLATGATLRFDGAAWVPPMVEALQNLELLGVSATADSVNRLSVASDATLLSHAGNGHQLKLNKAAVGDTASLLFQTGYSGRAEMGTAGNDDFSIKVSPDGVNFHDGMVVDGQTGEVAFPNGSSDFRERLSGDRSYHVRPDGSDSNDGLSNTAGGAFATIQNAVDAMMRLDCGNYDVTINVAAGTYPEAVTVSGLVLGSGTYKLRGDPAAPETVKIDRAIFEKNTMISMEGFEFTGGNGVIVRSRAQATLGAARFSGSGAAISMRDAFLDCNYATLEFASTITSIATMYNYANLSMYGTNLVIDANINWGASGAFYMRSFCLAWLQAAQFSGQTASCVGRRYNVGLNSALNTAGQGASFIPGDGAGTVEAGGQYI